MARYDHESEVIQDIENFYEVPNRSFTFKIDTNEEVESSTAVPGEKEI